MVAAAVTAASAVAASGRKGAAVKRDPPQTNCEGCGAPLVLREPLCAHCRRPRRGAEPSPGYEYVPGHRMPQPKPYEYTEAHRGGGNPYANPVQDYGLGLGILAGSAFGSSSSSDSSGSSDFSSGGGGDYGGGGSSGDF